MKSEATSLPYDVSDWLSVYKMILVSDLLIWFS